MNDSPKATLLAFLICAGSALAQIPRDYILSLEDSNPLAGEPGFRIISPTGTGVSIVRDQRTFFPFNSLAIDPVDPSRVLFESTASSLPGIWELTLVGATFDRAVWGPFGTTPTRRVAASTSNVFYVDAIGLHRYARSGGAAVLRLPTNDAKDLAIRGTTVYVVDTFGGQTPQVLAWDDATATSRVVGSYADAISVGTDGASRIVVGTSTGNVLTIDVASGQIVSTTAIGQGPIHAIATTTFGLPVFATSNAVWSFANLTTPLYSTANPITDIDVAQVGGGSAFRFGSACGPGTPTWVFPSRPDFGNVRFALAIQGARANAPAAVLLGASRVFSPTLGNLPVALDAIGMPGCRLLVDPGISIPATLDAQGAGNIPTPILTQPPLLGLELFGQWLYADANANPLGLVTSDGAVLIVR